MDWLKKIGSPLKTVRQRALNLILPRYSLIDTAVLPITRACLAVWWPGCKAARPAARPLRPASSRRRAVAAARQSDWRCCVACSDKLQQGILRNLNLVYLQNCSL